MALSEKELERIIEHQLSKEFDENIEVPDINIQWLKIKKQIEQSNTPTIQRRTAFNHKRLVFAAAILISIGTISVLYPHNANAFGGRIVKFFDYIVGKTAQNKTQTYKYTNDSEMPNVKDLGANIEKDVTLDQAQNSVPFKLAIPNYLPPETDTKRIALTSMGSDDYQVAIEYNIKDKAIVFTQQNSAIAASRGSLYDTDDTIQKDIIINGTPAMLFASKNGIYTLSWQIRGLLLQITSQISKEEIIKIANSIN